MAKTREYAFVYLFGGIMYGLMEVIWRGHTHWTMTLTGGTALLILYIINIKMSNCNIFLKCLIGASAITLLEFTVGVIINIILKWNVCNGVQREHNKKLNNGLPILHKVKALLADWRIHRTAFENGRITSSDYLEWMLQWPPTLSAPDD